MTDTVRGTQGDDLLELGDGDFLLTGAGGNDTLFVGVGTSTVAGQRGDDVLRTNDLEGKRFFGGDGFDTFEWVGGNVLLDMRGLIKGVEQIIGGGGWDTIKGTAHGETIIGDDGDVFYGREGNDYLRAGDLYGGAGNDTLVGSQMMGGEGNDVFVHPSQARFISILDFEDGDDLLDLGQSGLAFYDLNPVQESSFIRLFTPAGYVVIRGLRLEDFSIDDVIEAPRLKDTVVGTFADDLLERGYGDWLITGGNGNDTLIAGSGTSTLAGQNGDDVLRTNSLIGKTFFGGDGFDTFELLVTSQGSGALIDVRGPNGQLKSIEKIVGGDGADTIYGSNHAETIFGGRLQDQIHGRSGDDQIHGNGVSLVMEPDTIWGGAGNDTLFGTTDGKALGGLGDDSILLEWGRGFGGKGNDTLVATTSTARMFGGDGSDTFELRADETGATIRDFEDGSDRLDLGARFATFDDLIRAAREGTQDGRSGLIIDLEPDGSPSLFIENFLLSQLTPDDVIL